MNTTATGKKALQTNLHTPTRPASAGPQGAAFAPPDQTGLPDNLKTGIENLSGLSLEDVRVHYNSPKPAGLNALAYTQGSEIHVAPGQERHLPHEAWHLVQQKQARVRPTLQIRDAAINDDAGLEKEADVMGQRAGSGHIGPKQAARTGSPSGQAPVQLVNIKRGLKGVAGAVGGGLLGAGLLGLGGFAVAGPVGGVLGTVAGGTLGAGLGLWAGLRKRKPKIYARQTAWRDAELPDLLAHIQSLETPERRAYLDDREVRGQILQRSREEAVILMGALMQGSLGYNNAPATDFSRIFIESVQENHLDEGQTANCWEFILYSAWLAGALTAEEIRNFHVGKHNIFSYEAFGFDREKNKRYPDDTPEVGDLVFVESSSGKGRKRVDHVMLSLGGEKVLSHDDSGKQVEQTTIHAKDVGNHYTIYFTPSPWKDKL